MIAAPGPHHEDWGLFEPSRSCSGNPCEVCGRTALPGFTVCYDCAFEFGIGEYLVPPFRGGNRLMAYRTRRKKK